MAKYNINDRTILTDSGGRTLIAESLTHTGTFTATNTIETLSPDYFTNYFFTGFGGSTSGYTSGGAPTPINTIDKFPFSSDANATDVGDMSTPRTQGSNGQSSDANGYSSGGQNPSPPFLSNVIDKFPFSSDGNATDVGDLTQARLGPSGQSSTTHGYNSGGQLAPDKLNTIDKFPFSTDANATDVGDTTVGGNDAAGHSSASSGYMAGRSAFPLPLVAVIDKFPFSTDANATDVGDLAQTRYGNSGQSSASSGYTSGGGRVDPPPFVYTNTIDKFPFSSDTNATDVGDLTVLKWKSAGQSSKSNGYTSGGVAPPPSSPFNVIDKFPFSTDANATDVGDLTQSRSQTSGTQV